jgi:flagellar protein FlaG
MKVETLSTATFNPVGLENSGAGSIAISQGSTMQAHSVESSSQKDLQKKTRSTDEINKELDAINEKLNMSNSSLQFNVDETSQELVVRVVDRDSGKVIRQIPPESIVRLRASLKEMTGLLIEKKV